MPTAAKLVSAIAFALVGCLAALAYIPQLPVGTSPGYLTPAVTALGLLIGWRGMGRFAGKGWGESMGLGLKTSALLVPCSAA